MMRQSTLCTRTDPAAQVLTDLRCRVVRCDYVPAADFVDAHRLTALRLSSHRDFGLYYVSPEFLDRPFYAFTPTCSPIAGGDTCGTRACSKVLPYWDKRTPPPTGTICAECPSAAQY